MPTLCLIQTVAVADAHPAQLDLSISVLGNLTFVQIHSVPWAFCNCVIRISLLTLFSC